MAITVDSPIAGASAPENIAKAIAYVKNNGCSDDFTEAYIRKLYALCSAIGLRFALAFSQWCDETDIGCSVLWLTKHNPAGIGALPDGTYLGIDYKTPEESALGHLIHLWLYAKGQDLPPELPRSYRYLDPRWQAAIDAGNDGRGKTLRDLAGTWATNLNYAVQIAAHANKAFPGLPEGDTPMTGLTYGLVPPFRYVDDYIPDFAGMAAGWYGQRMVMGVVWHRMVGSLQGTRQHFRTPGTGLTDFGIGVGGWDASDLDGVIYRWNDPLGLRSGWANGTVLQPWGDGKDFVDEYAPKLGIDIVNRGQVSIEISGNYGTPITAKVRAAIVAITAYYADQAHIPWDVFPMWPGHDYSFVRWHQEFTGPQEKVCPGEVVMGETATLMEAVKARLKSFQTGSTPLPIPIYVKPSLPPWLAADLGSGIMKDHTLNGAPVYGCERVYTALRATPRRASASLSSDARVGPDIAKGESFVGCYVIGTKWVLTPHGTRVYLPDLTPSVIIAPRAA